MTSAGIRFAVSKLVAMGLDVAPTILQLAGIDVAAVGSDGMSLLSLIVDPSAGWRDALLIQYFEGSDEVPLRVENQVFMPMIFKRW